MGGPPILVTDQRQNRRFPLVISGNTVPVDANEYFETMNLISGAIEVQIYNGLPFDIMCVSELLRKNICCKE